VRGTALENGRFRRDLDVRGRRVDYGRRERRERRPEAGRPRAERLSRRQEIDCRRPGLDAGQGWMRPGREGKVRYRLQVRKSHPGPANVSQAKLRIAHEASLQDPAHARWDVVRECTWIDLPRQHSRQDVGHHLASEDLLPGQRFSTTDAERRDVGPAVDALPPGLPGPPPGSPTNVEPEVERSLYFLCSALSSSDRSRQVLPQYARVSCGDSQQSQCRPFGPPAVLLPVAQCVDADSESVGELLLGQPDEAAKRNDILASRKCPAKDTLSLLPRHGTGNIPVGQFTNLVAHISYLDALRSVGVPSWSPCAHSGAARRRRRVPGARPRSDRWGGVNASAAAGGLPSAGRATSSEGGRCSTPPL